MRLYPLGPAFALLLALALVGCAGDGPTEPAAADLPPNTVGPEGGTLSLAGGAVTLSFPPGALSESVTFEVAVAAAHPQSARLIDGTVFEIGPAGTTFGQPVELSIAYLRDRLPSGVDESTLGLHRAVEGEWARIDGSVVDVAGSRVTGSIGRLSTFGIVGHPPLAAVVINEVENIRIGGLLTDGEAPSHASDYVELYVLEGGSLEGIRMVATAADGQRYGEVELQGAAEPGDFILIGGSDVPGRDATFAGLQDGPGGLELLDLNGEVVDAVEWGGLGLGVAEGSAFPNLPPRAVLQRRTDGQDTDNNAADFCLQLEPRATPGGPNEPCPEFDASLWLEFVRNDTPVWRVRLSKSEWFAFDARLENSELLGATGPATAIFVSDLESLDPNVVQAVDLEPFPTDRLELNEGERQLVGVQCLVEQGETQVWKYATSPDDPSSSLFPPVAVLEVVCDPDDGDPDNGGPPRLPETDPEDLAVLAAMEVTIIEDPAVGSPEVSSATLAVGDRVQWAVRVRNISAPAERIALVDVFMPEIEPDGLTLVHQGTWPSFVSLRSGEEIHQTFTLECPARGEYRPFARAGAGNLPLRFPFVDSDEVDVTCVELAVRLDHALGSFVAGQEIALSRIENGLPAEADVGCDGPHLHAASPVGIRIDGAGPFPDPNPAGCGFGRLVLTADE